MAPSAPDEQELTGAAAAVKNALKPVIVAGGGIHYSAAHEALRDFAETHGIPVIETQAGKSALPWDHPLNFGPVGVTGADSANAVAAEADLIIGVGTRFQDFTTGSWALFKHPGRKLLALNAQPYDGSKHSSLPLVADAKVGLRALSNAIGAYRRQPVDATLKTNWFAAADRFTVAPSDGNALPTDMQVIGAVQRQARENSVVMCAAGTMPGELHQLWKAGRPMSYHMEYGFSCMGYEIAGGLGIKMAEPDRDVIVMVGDGSYMMANSELATSIMMGQKITVVVTDNRGFGCINRLQMATGGGEFNNLLDHAAHVNPSQIDFAAHAAAMGADSKKVGSIRELENALAEARNSLRTTVIVIDTDPYPTPETGGWWWDVAVPEVSEREQVRAARKTMKPRSRKETNL